MQIRMSARETALFMAFVSKAGSYFEFGMGGSTKAASEVVAGPIVAVESDQAWIDKAKSLIAPSPHERRFVFVDIGPIKKLGYPASQDERHKFPNYSSAILPFKDMDFELCLVDGRFRVACFLQALKTLSSYSIIGVHDYRSRRGYHIVENFAKPIAEVEDLTFFTRRPNLDPAKVEKALEKYQFVIH